MEQVTAPPTDGEHFDTVVIGGGITGAAAARELARAGISVFLLEANDFASGTTSRTSRLQYCGLAYLASFVEFGNIFRHPVRFLTALRLARRSMTERRRFLSSHPHLLRPVPFQIPIFANEGPSRIKMAMGMILMSALDPASPLEWHLMGREEAENLPFMEGSRQPLAGAIVYTDYQYNWPERVCIDVLEEAKALGATARNHAPVVSLAKAGSGWRVAYDDLRTGQSHYVKASTVINCAGPWVDDLPSRSGLQLTKVNSGEKGANMMVRLPGRYRGVGFQVRTEKDGTFYIVPWNDLHYVGPVNTVMEANELDSFRVTDAEQERLHQLTARYLPVLDTIDLKPLFAWAGTRPRTRDPRSGGPAPVPRLHGPIETGQDGYFVYSGGLLMMHDSIGKECARAVSRWLGRSWSKKTGAAGLPPSPQRSTDLTQDNVKRMVRDEQALTLEDIMFRRTACGWEEDMGVSVLSDVADWLGEELGWSATERDSAIAHYRWWITHQFNAPA